MEEETFPFYELVAKQQQQQQKGLNCDYDQRGLSGALRKDYAAGVFSFPSLGIQVAAHDTFPDAVLSVHLSTLRQLHTITSDPTTPPPSPPPASPRTSMPL